MTRFIDTILAIDLDIDEMRTQLESLGIGLIEAATCEEGVQKYIESRPELVVLNIDTPDSIERIKVFKHVDPEAHIIPVSRCSDASFIIECLRIGIVDYIIKPVKPTDFVTAINRVDIRKRIEAEKSNADTRCVREEHKTLVFGNDISALPLIINQAVYNSSNICPDRDTLKMVLHEVILNAIEHGNLGITREEKSKAIEGGTFAELFSQKSGNSLLAEKTVTLEVKMDNDLLSFEITDEGNGFDYRGLFSSDSPPTGESGLGLLMAKGFFSEIKFQGSGNKVVLVYKRK